MHWQDRRILFTALGFLAVSMKDGNSESADHAYRARAFAGLLEDFCRDNAQAGAAAIDLDSTMSVEAIDQVIEHHVRELRMTDETRLPEDRDTLLRLYDRLQHRAIRREQAEFYAQAYGEMLAERVLSYLDAEIAERDSNPLQASA